LRFGVGAPVLTCFAAQLSCRSEESWGTKVRCTPRLVAGPCTNQRPWGDSLILVVRALLSLDLLRCSPIQGHVGTADPELRKCLACGSRRAAISPYFQDRAHATLCSICPCGSLCHASRVVLASSCVRQMRQPIRRADTNSLATRTICAHGMPAASLAAPKTT